MHTPQAYTRNTPEEIKSPRNFIFRLPLPFPGLLSSLCHLSLSLSFISWSPLSLSLSHFFPALSCSPLSFSLSFLPRALLVTSLFLSHLFPALSWSPLSFSLIYSPRSPGHLYLSLSFIPRALLVTSLFLSLISSPRSPGHLSLSLSFLPRLFHINIEVIHNYRRVMLAWAVGREPREHTPVAPFMAHTTLTPHENTGICGPH